MVRRPGHARRADHRSDGFGATNRRSGRAETHRGPDRAGWPTAVGVGADGCLWLLTFQPGSPVHAGHVGRTRGCGPLALPTPGWPGTDQGAGFSVAIRG